MYNSPAGFQLNARAQRSRQSHIIIICIISADRTVFIGVLLYNIQSDKILCKKILRKTLF